MEAKELRKYRRRWDAVVAVENEEQRRASTESRWLQLNRLLAMAAAMGLKENISQGDVDAVRRRWNRLKDMSEDLSRG